MGILKALLVDEQYRERRTDVVDVCQGQRCERSLFHVEPSRGTLWYDPCWKQGRRVAGHDCQGRGTFMQRHRTHNILRHKSLR
jgi:hypothetical protein